MEARLDYTGDPVAMKFIKHVNAGIAVFSGSKLPAATAELVKIRASQINGCAVCLDMHTKDAAQAGETQLRLNLVAAWREATVFTEAERAALELAEQGTRLAARVRRGELTPPDDDVLAGRYVIADQTLSAAGYHWYEISNWAASAGARCAHNMLYWTGGDWWGIGPGAHSHVGGTRWWNVRHPAAWASRVGDGVSPGQAREVLTGDEKQLERVMLEIRLADGYPLSAVDLSVIPALDGLVRMDSDRLFLTQRGRLLADTVVRALTP